MDKKMPSILMVEDDIAISTLYKSRLEMEGFTVQHSPDGEAGLAALQTFKPDLMLIDLMMPKLDGFNVIDIVHNTPAYMNIKIIVLSAMSQPADQQRALDLGADEYLIKSQVVMDDVIAAIRRQLNILPPTAAA